MFTYDICSGDIPQTFRTLEREVRYLTPDLKLLRSLAIQILQGVLTEVRALMGHKRSDVSPSNPLSKRFLWSLHTFEHWLASTHQSLAGFQVPAARSTTHNLTGDIDIC